METPHNWMHTPHNWMETPLHWMQTPLHWDRHACKMEMFQTMRPPPSLCDDADCLSCLLLHSVSCFFLFIYFFFFWPFRSSTSFCLSMNLFTWEFSFWPYSLNVPNWYRVEKPVLHLILPVSMTTACLVGRWMLLQVVHICVDAVRTTSGLLAWD